MKIKPRCALLTGFLLLFVFALAAQVVFKGGAQPQAASSSGSRTNVVAQSLDRGILDLFSRVEKAVRAGSAAQLVACYYIEPAFDTPQVRSNNVWQAQLLLQNDSLSVEIADIRGNEMKEIQRLQKSTIPNSPKYSLDPKKMLWIRYCIPGGTKGRGFLIGEREGKWHIITMAGYTT